MFGLYVWLDLEVQHLIEIYINQKNTTKFHRIQKIELFKIQKDLKYVGEWINENNKENCNGDEVDFSINRRN